MQEVKGYNENRPQKHKNAETREMKPFETRSTYKRDPCRQLKPPPERAPEDRLGSKGEKQVQHVCTGLTCRVHNARCPGAMSESPGH